MFDGPLSFELLTLGKTLIVCTMTAMKQKTLEQAVTLSLT